ncbi:hypothetical protein HZA43_05535, partial [Candidatus Peregrinibacteria bacterium]|nr:hypothetical protein [Candidatus Peregrinibacteria bacterium]
AEHTVEFYSTDAAGNGEAAQTAVVRFGQRGSQRHSRRHETDPDTGEPLPDCEGNPDFLATNETGCKEYLDCLSAGESDCSLENLKIIKEKPTKIDNKSPEIKEAPVKLKEKSAKIERPRKPLIKKRTGLGRRKYTQLSQ